MPFKVEATPAFLSEAKKLSRKYPSIKNDIASLADTLAFDPMQGTPLGKNVFKIRMAIASKGKGKSGGSRVITYVKVTSTIVYLISIYDKSEQDNISDKEIKDHLKSLP